MAGWNFADVWEVSADALPEQQCLVQGDRRLSWQDVDRRADGVAAWLLSLGIAEQGKVAQYLHNCPEYVESMFAAFKVGLVPVNTNYRYEDEELLYLWDNADAVAVVFHGAFSERVDRLRPSLTKVRGWLWVDDATGPCPDWATSYEEVAQQAHPRQRAAWGRDGDQAYMAYTGGTTGMPKGVIWRQDDLVQVLFTSIGLELSDDADYKFMRSMRGAPGDVALPASPLMHATGAMTAMKTMSLGGSVVLLAQRTYDPVELLDTIEAEKVNALALVGDAFAKPMLRLLDQRPDHWNLSTLVSITSSGVMWSAETKQGLLRHHAEMSLVDGFSSSEAIGMGASVSGAGATAKTGAFELGAAAVVIADDGTFVTAGSGVMGMVGVGGRLPVGYYKDAEKTARTFRLIDGRRYSIPGDYARIESDGSITLLGRGSVCINTGGEKVFPEEVEEVLKRHRDVRDCVVVGVPDDKWGEAITALVEVEPGASTAEAQLTAHVRQHLAGYKTPKRVIVVDSIGRAPNGKVDYQASRQRVVDQPPVVTAT